MAIDAATRSVPADLRVTGLTTARAPHAPTPAQAVTDFTSRYRGNF